ncbi:MAG TPA: hypothetical protein VN408_21075, partial [Actinoplanes sp.]|nr:hypothetical protein [Actinoplanes sp.]
LSVLFTESDTWQYSVEVCEDAWRLIVADQGQGDPRVVREWSDPATDAGEDIRLQLLVQDGMVRIGHDGVLIGDHKIGPGFGLRNELGVTSAPATEQGPFLVSYADAEVHALG